MKKYGLKNFEELNTSTVTVMIYTNINFNVSEIFSSLTLYEDTEIFLTKKQKNIDKKRILSPYGSIISVQSKTRIRGLDLRKKKAKWCTVCRLYKVNNESTSEKKKLLTVSEYLVKEKDENGDESDTKCIKYYCSHCQMTYDPWEVKKINHFLNQLTVVLSIGKRPMLNIMMFKDNLKIAGCKSVEDAVEALMVLWQDYIVDNKSLWALKKGFTRPKFQFEVVMRNVDFKLGFPIEKKKINILMNNPIYSKNIFMSQYEATGQPCVNIKMYSRKPDDFEYDCLVMPVGRNPYFVKVNDLSFRKKKKKPKGSKYITFIVFSSSEVILSGRYDKNMKEMYNFFVKLSLENKKSIMEILDTPDENVLEEIRTEHGY